MATLKQNQSGTFQLLHSEE